LAAGYAAGRYRSIRVGLSMPLRWWVPASSKERFDPTTKSAVVLETSTSSAPASLSVVPRQVVNGGGHPGPDTVRRPWDSGGLTRSAGWWSPPLLTSARSAWARTAPRDWTSSGSTSPSKPRADSPSTSGPMTRALSAAWSVDGMPYSSRHDPRACMRLGPVCRDGSTHVKRPLRAGAQRPTRGSTRLYSRV